MKPAFFGLQNHSFPKNPILVIDRSGLIGEPLSLKLSKEFLVVFVSRRGSDLDVESQNIVHVPFSKKTPSIPGNAYSHIIFIDEEGEDLELLPKIINKAKDINADFIFAQSLFLQSKHTIDEILQMHHSAKVVLIGDIFNNELILKKESFKSVINRFLYQAQGSGKIQILGDGLREAYPVFLDDVVNGLIDLVFKIHKSHSLFYIFPKYPPTEISLVHMIQKSNPEIMMDFAKRDPKQKSISYPPNGKYLLDDKYKLAKKIRGIDIKISSAGGKMRNDDQNKITEKLKSFPFFVIWVLLFLIIFPFIFTIFFSFLGKSTLYYAEREINKGNFSNAKSSFHLSQTFFYLGKQASNIFSLQAKTVRQENNFKKLLADINSGHKVSEGISQVFNSGTYFSKVLSGKSKDPIGDFMKGGNYLKSSIITLNKIKAEGEIYTPILQNLEAINPLIKLLSNTVDIMPNIFGMEGSKTYLILFQDNMELRPGGGLIDSYGILKLNMGKITQFTIYGVYDADKQLRGHVEPPFALRRYLPEQHWYMKDSNFDVDFVKSASSSSNFLFVETGQKADGVIGVDDSFIKSILRAIGSVYVVGYKENVNENNLYLLMQSHAGKSDFLRALYETIVTKIMEEKVSYFLIAQAISDSLAQKHLLFAFNNNLQSIFTVNDWSSSLWDERKDGKGSVNDYMGINEANLGINKANYFIKRQVVQSVKIEPDGSLFGEVNLSYKNTSISWSGGDYKNYLRIILPLNASISSILINDVRQPMASAITAFQVYEAKNFKVPSGLEIEKSIESGKTIYGFLVNIPAGALVKIKIQYIVSRENTFDSNNFSYSLKIFKQPGIDTLPYSLFLYYPDNLSVINVGELKKEDNSLLYAESITEDKELTASFAVK